MKMLEKLKQLFKTSSKIKTFSELRPRDEIWFGREKGRVFSKQFGIVHFYVEDGSDDYYVNIKGNENKTEMKFMDRVLATYEDSLL
jgi:hypothetical protein